MRKHRHLPFVAMFCLLLSGFCSVHAQQQAGKTRLLYPTLPPYKHVASSHHLVFNMHDDTLWFTFCSSAPIRLRVLSDLSQRVWCLPEHVAGWWPLRMLCGDRGCAPRVASSRFSPGQSCFVLLACVEGLFCREKSTVTNLTKGCIF